MSLLNDQLDKIIDLVKKSKDTSEELEAKWEADREDFSEFKNRLGHLEEEFKSFKGEFREAMKRIPNQTQKQVAEAVGPVISGAQELKETIEHKKAIPIQDGTRNVFKKFWNWFKKGWE